MKYLINGRGGEGRGGEGRGGEGRLTLAEPRVGCRGESWPALSTERRKQDTSYTYHSRRFSIHVHTHTHTHTH